MGAGALDAQVSEYCKAEGIPSFSMYGEEGGVYQDLAGKAISLLYLAFFFYLSGFLCPEMCKYYGALTCFRSLLAWLNRIPEAEKQSC